LLLAQPGTATPLSSVVRWARRLLYATGMTLRTLRAGCFGVVTAFVVLGLGSGCYDGHDSQPSDSDAAIDSQAGRAGLAMPPAAALDAGVLPGDSCKKSVPLSEWSAKYSCPTQLGDAREQLCENLMGGSQSAAVVLSSPHDLAPNSCGGFSATHYMGHAGTRYHYDATGALVGVTAFDGIVLPACSDVYGKTCTITAQADRLCAVSCPAIACINGLNVKLDAPKKPATYANARLEICHNDRCTTTSLGPDAAPGPEGVGTVLFNDTLASGMLVTFTLWQREPESWVEFDLGAHDTSLLRDGDSYVIRLTQKDGTPLYQIYETVDHYDNHEIGAPCTQQCKRRAVDYRDAIEVDAGSP
jgi:hypothetical protein